MNKLASIGPNKVITMQYSLTNTDGVVVREATGAAKLAGNQSLVFEIEIQGIRDATDEEINQGKVID